MINTLQNSPEKTPSKGGNKFKKAIALAIALTLSGKPAEAKTYEKQEFPTEMLASIPGEYAPITENVEQASVPNYINQAKIGVKKYYPQYEEYFKPIFGKINNINYGWKTIINKRINENFEIFEEELTTEKDKLTTILIALDDLLGEKSFIRSRKSVDSKEGEELLKGIAKEITSDIKVQFSKELKESRQQLASEKEKLASEKEKLASEKEKLASEKEKLASEKEKLASEKEKSARIKKIKENINNNETPEKILKSIEELIEITDINEIKTSKGTQEIIKHYISIGKKTKWNWSQKGKRMIEAYYNL